MNYSTFKTTQNSWLIKIGNRFNASNKLGIGHATLIVFLGPQAIWFGTLIVFRALDVDVKTTLSSSFVFSSMAISFYVFLPVAFIARRMSDKLFGDMFWRQKNGVNNVTTMEHYNQSVNDQDYRRARLIVIYQVIYTFCFLLLGFLFGAAMFHFLAY
ncbi:hypothetical protein [Thiobacillus thioparus]|uniref:hypothetical protein n=1 Tax=Thiobacillus thioparus TaxID=931 RepID=UPI0012FCAE56|nr:hypothetical protein [Thiobacillus thioparus]